MWVPSKHSVHSNTTTDNNNNKVANSVLTPKYMFFHCFS